MAAASKEVFLFENRALSFGSFWVNCALFEKFLMIRA
jgi:hypothetical protein